MLKLLLLIIISNIAFANTSIINENPLQINKSLFLQESAQVGADVELQIEVKLAEKHHAYVKQFKVKPKGTLKDAQVKPLLVKPTVEFYDHLAKKTKLGIEDKAVIKTSFEVPHHLRNGEQIFSFYLQYQACTKDYCLLPIDLEFKAPLTITGAHTSEEASGSFSLASIDLSGKSTNIFLILLAIFFAGILTSFTPCIYPMIPITLAVLGSSKSESKISKRLFLSLCYVLGIALTYSLLGVVAASTGGLFGSYLNHPIVRASLVLLFVTMSLSMFGVFEIQAPAFIRNKFAAKQFKQNYLGAFFTGAVAGIIASPCVGPVLVTILTFVAETKNLLLGFLYLFVFALGLGLIFIVLGVFSQGLKSLPKSGAWMDITKYFFGSLMLAMAAFYFEPLASSTLFYLFLIFLLSIAFYFCRKLIKGDVLKPLVTLLLIAGMAFAALNLFPQFNEGFLALTKSKDPMAPEWKVFSDQLIKEAKENQKGVIIDFYADWCAACKELEHKTFNQPLVKDVGENFYWLKYDATETNPVFEKLKERYEIFGLPHIVIYSPDGTYQKELTLTGFEEAAPFAERLKKALQ